MKKVILITLMLLVSCSMVMAAPDGWTLKIKTGWWGGEPGVDDPTIMYNSGIDFQLGVKATSLDGLDSSDTTTDVAATGTSLAWAVTLFEGSDSIHGRSFQSPVIPVSGQKLWPLKIGSLAEYPGDVITVQVNLTTTGLKPANIGSALSGFEGMPLVYKLYNSQMVELLTLDYSIVEAAAVSNVNWGQIVLPKSLVSIPNSKTSWEGAQTIYFAQEAVIPEPGSMLVLGTGLVGLLGFASRRRRA